MVTNVHWPCTSMVSPTLSTVDHVPVVIYAVSNRTGAWST